MGIGRRPTDDKNEVITLSKIQFYERAISTIK
jgi:hypothetical protein